MPGYNVDFQLSVEDVDLIEDALRRSKLELSQKAITKPHAEYETSRVSMRRIHDLLGRLHNQKVFYRPKRSPYVSG